MDKMKLVGYFCLITLIVIVILSIWGFKEEHYLGKGYTYFEDPSSISYWKFGDSLQYDIPPDILKYDNRMNTILVKQKPRQFRHSEDTEYNYSCGRDSTYYFFINKKTKKAYGPILYSEMKEFLKEEKLIQRLNRLTMD